MFSFSKISLLLESHLIEQSDCSIVCPNLQCRCIAEPNPLDASLQIIFLIFLPEVIQIGHLNLIGQGKNVIGKIGNAVAGAPKGMLDILRISLMPHLNICEQTVLCSTIRSIRRIFWTLSSGFISGTG